jgi:hypothetical protein
LKLGWNGLLLFIGAIEEEEVRRRGFNNMNKKYSNLTTTTTTTYTDLRFSTTKLFVIFTNRVLQYGKIEDFFYFMGSFFV